MQNSFPTFNYNASTRCYLRREHNHGTASTPSWLMFQWGCILATCSIVLLWSIWYFAFISLNSERASRWLSAPLPCIARPVQKQNVKRHKGEWRHIQWIGSMCVLKGTSLVVVFCLIFSIISSTLSAGCFSGLQDGSCLICGPKKGFLEDGKSFLLLQGSGKIYSNLTGILGVNNNECCVSQNLFFSFSGWYLEAIKFWFGLSGNIKVSQCEFQHPNSRLDSCWRKKKYIPLRYGGDCMAKFLRASRNYKNK